MSKTTDAKYKCLDLFCGLGGFSAAFRDADHWDVTTVDINPEFDPDIVIDIFDLQPDDLASDWDVILASPPCQYLSVAGNFDMWDFENKEPIATESENAVALFYHTIGLIQALSPDFYYIENPKNSRIKWFIGPPDEWVTYCQYGKDYQKPTGLWGEFAPMTFRRCTAGSDCHRSNSADGGYSSIQSMPSDSGVRSKVAYGLSEQIKNAIEGRTEQKSFADF